MVEDRTVARRRAGSFDRAMTTGHGREDDRGANADADRREHA